MPRHFKKSTLAEIEKMKQWYKEGVSYSEIGRRLGKNHATIIWHIKHKNLYQYDRKPTIKGKEIKEKEEMEKVKKIPVINHTHCIVCQKEKEPKWIKTNFCGNVCFSKYNRKPMWYEENKKVDYGG